MSYASATNAFGGTPTLSGTVNILVGMLVTYSNGVTVESTSYFNILV